MLHLLRKFAVLCLIGLVSGATFGQANGAYSHERSVAVARPDWLAGVSGAKRLHELNLPGTHDSVTGEYFGPVPGVETQTLGLAAQLEAGIRVLDIRCRHIGNAFAIHHGIVYLGRNFDDVLGTVTDFLRRHPTETVAMRVKEEHEPADNTRSFSETFGAYWSDPRYAPYFWAPTSTDPSLDEIRGRIVVLQDFSLAPTTYGIDYGSLNIQDDYVVSSITAQYDKWLKVKAHLERAHQAQATWHTPYMNYLSGSTGVLPYFVASGKVTASTSSSQLLTGLTTPLFKSWWPDFPRVGCFWGMCSIAYDGTNHLTSDYIWRAAYEWRYAGLVMADYPGPDLIQAVIQLNFH